MNKENAYDLESQRGWAEKFSHVAQRRASPPDLVIQIECHVALI